MKRLEETLSRSQPTTRRVTRAQKALTLTTISVAKQNAGTEPQSTQETPALQKKVVTTADGSLAAEADNDDADVRTNEATKAENEPAGCDAAIDEASSLLMLRESEQSQSLSVAAIDIKLQVVVDESSQATNVPATSQPSALDVEELAPLLPLLQAEIKKRGRTKGVKVTKAVVNQNAQQQPQQQRKRESKAARKLKDPSKAVTVESSATKKPAKAAVAKMLHVDKSTQADLTLTPETILRACERSEQTRNLVCRRLNLNPQKARKRPRQTLPAVVPPSTLAASIPTREVIELDAGGAESALMPPYSEMCCRTTTNSTIVAPLDLQHPSSERQKLFKRTRQRWAMPKKWYTFDPQKRTYPEQLKPVVLATTELQRDDLTGKAMYAQGPPLIFSMIKESCLPSFQVKKVQKFLRDQHKDDDVQSDEELVANTKFQVLQNLKQAIKDYNTVLPLQQPGSHNFSHGGFYGYKSEILQRRQALVRNLRPSQLGYLPEDLKQAPHC